MLENVYQIFSGKHAYCCSVSRVCGFPCLRWCGGYKVLCVIHVWFFFDVEFLMPMELFFASYFVWIITKMVFKKSMIQETCPELFLFGIFACGQSDSNLTDFIFGTLCHSICGKKRRKKLKLCRETAQADIVNLAKGKLYLVYQ